MVSTSVKITHYQGVFLALAMTIGVSVLITLSAILVIGLLWGLAVTISIVLAHVSSLQLMLIVVIAYQVWGTIKRRIVR